jgi:hypothetical protein
MRKIYIDESFKCHAESGDGLREVETNHFDGKCDTYIEGYRFVPSGETWVREDGVSFPGEMITPWKEYSELDEAQREYEREQFADMREALALLGVTVDE